MKPPKTPSNRGLIDSVYLLAARRDNPNASEEAIRRYARKLREACLKNARGYARERHPNGTHKPI